MSKPKNKIREKQREMRRERERKEPESRNYNISGHLVLKSNLLKRKLLFSVGFAKDIWATDPHHS